jgi:antitoxin (DNA-binding transcriptional repressor) of toxin-antitoxin stability system
METEISKSRFRAHALEIFRRIEQTGDAVIISDHGTPSLIITKYIPSRSGALQRLKGSVLRYDAPLDPVAADDWESTK